MKIQLGLVRNLILAFEGGTNPIAVYNWMSDIEHKFHYIGATDTYLMALITFQKEAEAWWKGEMSLMVMWI